MSTAVRDNPTLSRFELTANGATAVANYHRADGTIIFTHTEVPPELRGRGMGSRLVQGALDSARSQNLKVVPRCSFVSDFIARHPDYRDLVD